MHSASYRSFAFQYTTIGVLMCMYMYVYCLRLLLTTHTMYNHIWITTYHLHLYLQYSYNHLVYHRLQQITQPQRMVVGIVAYYHLWLLKVHVTIVAPPQQFCGYRCNVHTSVTSQNTASVVLVIRVNTPPPDLAKLIPYVDCNTGLIRLCLHDFIKPDHVLNYKENGPNQLFLVSN